MPESMDTDLLKTFLEVNRTRHFGQAADNLFLTQSAISSRIRLLEQIVGIPLFSRDRGNIQLTPAGSKLVPHAERILNSWNRARQEISIEDEQVTPLLIGSEPNIWDAVLQDWLHRIYSARDDLAVTTEIGFSDMLIRRVTNGTLDLAFLFSSPQVSELTSHAVGAVNLVLVSTHPGVAADRATSNDYVRVDWGTPFDVAHARAFPDIPPPRARLASGQSAHQFLLHCGGSAYLAESSVSDDIRRGRLHRVADAPAISRDAYAVHSNRAPNRDLIEVMLQQLVVSA